MHQPFFSLIIPYRNRSLRTVQRCLQSIGRQSFDSFEVLLVDYGSEPSYGQSICQKMAKTPFMRYVYTETRGFFWSRGAALNLGLTLAKGEVIIAVDVDLILTPDFLEAIYKQYEEDHFLIYPALNMPEMPEEELDLVDLPTLPILSKLKQEHYQDPSYLGCIVVERDKLLKVNGYDEFYRLWGREDVDLARRLEQQLALKKKVLSVEQAFVLHQWHPPVQLPKGWIEVIHRYFDDTSIQLQPNRTAWHTPLQLSDRPALAVALNQRYHVNDPTNDSGLTQNSFKFEFPKEQAFVFFLLRFQQLPSKHYLVINQDFSPAVIQKGSKLGFGVKLLNYWAKKMNISYRLMDLNTAHSEWLTAEEIKNFLFYFVLHFQPEINDYFFQIDQNQIHFVLQKK